MARKGAFVIICENDKILLVKRTDVPAWDLPGGGVWKDETETDAAIRETNEETGYHIKILYKIGEYLRPEVNDTQFIYQAVICGGEEISKGDETAKLKWFEKTSLPLLMIPHRKRQIKDFFASYKDIQITLKEPFIIKLFQK